MLRKLFKHDNKAIARYFWPMALCSVIATVLGTIMIRLLADSAFAGVVNAGNSMVGILVGIMLVVCCLVIFAFSIVMFVMVLKRYYDNFFTDEGYLTFTLPCETKSLLMSKTLSAFLWLVLTTVVTVVCIFVMVLFGSATKGLINTEVIDFIGKVFSELYGYKDAWFITGELLLLCIASCFYSICIIYLSITIGSIIAKKHKILAAVGIYYAISTVLSIILSVAANILGSTSGYFETTTIIDAETCIEYTMPVVHSTFLLFAAVIALIAVTAYFVNRFLLTRKLNLS